MQIQPQDFPSDIYGETYKLRDELIKCLQRSCTSESGAKLFRDMLKFAVAKLKEADAERTASVDAAS